MFLGVLNKYSLFPLVSFYRNIEILLLINISDVLLYKGRENVILYITFCITIFKVLNITINKYKLEEFNLAKKIAVAFNKGGSGKTTTTINVAGEVSINEPETKICVVDKDGQGNTTSSFQIDKNSLEFTSYDVLIGNVESNEIESKVIQSTVIDNIDVLPANSDLNFLEFDLMNLYSEQIKDNIYEFIQKFKATPERLFEIERDSFKDLISKEVEIDTYYFNMINSKLDVLEEKYDVIFFDTPPELKSVTSSVLAIVDSVIIPFEPDTYSLEGLINILRRIDEIKKKYNPKLEIAGILATKVENRTKQHSDIIKEVVKFCAKNQIRFFDTEIPKSIKFGSSITYEGLPATLTNADNKFVHSYHDLYSELKEASIL